MTEESLCTYHGTLVYYDTTENRLRHGLPGKVPHNAALLSGDGSCWMAARDGDAWQRLDGFGASGEISREATGAAPLLFRARRLAEGRLALEANGLCLCAEADGALTLSRQVQGLWETFYPLDAADLDFLAYVGARSWLNAAGAPVPGADGIRVAPNFRARIGSLDVPLPVLLAGRYRLRDDAWAVQYEGWKLEWLTAYRPLVYLIAFGRDDIFQSLALALQALYEFGRYRGDVLIFSDRSLEALAPYIPDGMAPQIRVAAAPARDVLDMMAIKYRIVDMPELAAYQPLLYLDADVICNRPLEPILLRLLRAGRICVPLELDLMGDHNFYGASLFAADPGATHGHPRGFSAGLIGIPNMAVARRVFPVVLDCMYGLARSLGTRTFSPWYDQPAANYVLHKINEADFVMMSEVTATPVDFTRPVASIPRLGFAHFCGGVGNTAPKLPFMQDYLDLLRRII